MNNKILQLSIFTIGIAVMRIGWFASIPFLTIYIHNNTTSNPLVIGIIMGSGWLTASIGGVFGGLVVDRYKPKKIMGISLILSSFTMFLYAAVNPKSILLLLLLNSLVGVFIAFFEIGSKTYISKNFTDKYKMHAFNLRYTAMNIGAAIGPFIGVWLTFYNPKVMFVFTAIIYLFVAFGIYLALKEEVNINEVVKYKLKEIFKIIINDQALLILTLLYFLCFIAFAQIETSLPQVMENRISNYTIVYASLLSINAIIVIVIQVPMGFVLHKMNKVLLSYISSLMFAASFAVFAFAHSKLMFIIAIIFFALAEVIYSTLINLFVDDIASKQMQGVYFGVANLGMLGLFFGPIIGGFMLKFFSGVTLYLALSCIMVLSLILYKRLSTILAKKQIST